VKDLPHSIRDETRKFRSLSFLEQPGSLQSFNMECFQLAPLFQCLLPRSCLHKLLKLLKSLIYVQRDAPFCSLLLTTLYMFRVFFAHHQEPYEPYNVVYGKGMWSIWFWQLQILSNDIQCKYNTNTKFSTYGNEISFTWMVFYQYSNWSMYDRDWYYCQYFPTFTRAW
jgi:hypothetical protein